jgi:transposase-like protein
METMTHEKKQVSTRARTQGDENKCPSCDSDAIYKYGKTRSHKQRYLCIVCGKQFTDHPERATVKSKPVCPECGRHMNLYKIEGDVVRFRCSGYPECRTFKKYRMKEE